MKYAKNRTNARKNRKSARWLSNSSIPKQLSVITQGSKIEGPAGGLHLCKVVCIWQSALFRFTPLSVSFRVAPCSVSHHFRFVPFRGVPCRKFSVSFRFAYCRVARFPFHSVSWYGVSQIFVSFRFVSCRVPIVPFRPVSHFPCHTVPFRLGYGSDIYIYIL